MKKLSTFVVIAFLAIAGTAFARTETTVDGEFSFKLTEKSYTSTGELIPGQQRVDLYEIRVTNADGEIVNLRKIASADVLQGTNVFRVIFAGENAFTAEGSYQVAFRKVHEGADGVVYTVQWENAPTIEVVFSIPVPPTPTPTETEVPPTPTETAVPTATATNTPVPTVTPTAIVPPSQFDLGDIDFSDETDFGSETDFSTLKEDSLLDLLNGLR